MQHLDPDLLRAFVMVAETSSFTKAGERLFRTQASISMQIKRLEERIGKTLFVRGPKGSQLTDEGELLIHYARQILLLNDEALANLSVERQEDVVRVGASDDYARILLPDMLLFNKVFPDVQLDLVCDNRLNLLRELRDGRVDLALVVGDPETGDGELLRREQLHWITSTANSPHTSNFLPLALASDHCVRRDRALRALKESERSFKIVLSSGTTATIIAAVSSGVAVSVVEDFAMPEGLRQLREEDGLPFLGEVDLVLYRAPGHPRRPAAELAKHIRLSLRRQTLEQSAAE